MKKALAFYLFAVLLFSYSANAKILRVGYSGQPVSGVDFNNTQSAVDAATAGDTIQLYQNVNTGYALNINKRLVFIGLGYNLGSNSGLQVLKETADRPIIGFVPGSENSIVQGVCGSFYVGTNNITISRSTGDVYLGRKYAYESVTVSNISVLNGWYGLYDYGDVSNLTVSNSILYAASLDKATGLFTNNVFNGNTGFSFKSFVVKNSMFVTNGCPSNSTGSVFENNLFRSTACTITGSNNLFNVDMSTVFIDVNNVGPESNLALKAGSPAIGFGVDGSGNPTDAGIFGGDAGLVYKLSGIPAIPAIYQLTAPQLNANTNPYTISVSVRSNN